MADGKKSFLLYCDIISTIEKLPKEKAGELFMLILDYVNDKNPETNDIILQIAFEPIKLQLKRDLKKYKDILKKRSLAGKASAEKRQQVSTHVEFVEHTSTNSTDNDTDNVIVTDIKKNIIYSEFYDSQLLLSNNDKNYLIFIKYLFGENELKKKFSGILSIRDQLTFEQFTKLLETCKSNKTTIREILNKMENDKKYYKGKTFLYTCLNNWATSRFVK